MSAVFGEIQDLYQRSIQPDSKIVFKSKTFIQTLLYAVDPTYNKLTERDYSDAIKAGKPKQLHECYPELSQYWCEAFIEYFIELNMKKIIDEYYAPIQSNDKPNYKPIKGNIHNKAYTIIPMNKLYPKMFIHHLCLNCVPTKIFDPSEPPGYVKPPVTTNIVDHINKRIEEGFEDYAISKYLHSLLSNIVYVPKNIKCDIKFLHTLVNNYDPTYKHFLKGYILNNAEEFYASNDELAKIISKLVTTTDSIELKLFTRMLKEWYQFYETADGKTHRRNICKSNNINDITH